MDKQFHPKFYSGCDDLCVQVISLNHGTLHDIKAIIQHRHMHSVAVSSASRHYLNQICSTGSSVEKFCEIWKKLPIHKYAWKCRLLFSVVLNVVMPYLNEHSLKVNGWMHEWNFPRIQTIMGVKTDGNGYELIITLRRNIDHIYFINWSSFGRRDLISIHIKNVHVHIVSFL